MVEEEEEEEEEEENDNEGKLAVGSRFILLWGGREEGRGSAIGSCLRFVAAGAMRPSGRLKKVAPLPLTLRSNASRARAASSSHAK